ncbi:heavy-metal-associated domain-containing protein [Wukongibacter baidiensis]|uniref:heavy-metal-associated domain-containing protein n=1 Tax=Wukongibacter baidiensis TaxID=1723361 RepID=UPI003D7FA851
MKKKIVIEGMSCGHCAGHVTGALKDVSGVEEVEIIVADGLAIVELAHEVDDENLIDAIEEVGYNAVEVEEI